MTDTYFSDKRSYAILLEGYRGREGHPQLQTSDCIPSLSPIQPAVDRLARNSKASTTHSYLFLVLAPWGFHSRLSLAQAHESDAKPSWQQPVTRQRRCPPPTSLQLFTQRSFAVVQARSSPIARHQPAHSTPLQLRRVLDSNRAICCLSRRVSIPAHHSLLVTPGAPAHLHCVVSTDRPPSPPIATDTLFSAYTVPCYSSRRVQKSRQLPIHNSAFPSNRISSSFMLQPSFGSQPPQSNLAPIRALYRSKHTTTRPSTSIMRDSNGVSYSRPPHALFTYTVTSMT